MTTNHVDSPPTTALTDQLAQAVFESLTAQIAVLDAQGSIVAVNPAWIRFAQENGSPLCAAESVGMNYLAACQCGGDAPPDGQDGAEQAAAGIQGVLAGVIDQFTLEYPCHSPTEQRWFLLYVSPLHTGKGAVVAHINITQRKHSELRITQLAHYDTLTGLPNRVLFTHTLDEALRQARDRVHALAVLFLDLDGFKKVNDTLGHDAGDRLLTVVAERLRAAVRADDTVARLAGDEFTVILPVITAPEQAASVARKLLQGVAAPIALDEQVVQVSASIGISLYPAGGETAHSLLKSADAAMYRAKRQGKNAYRFG